MWQWHWVEMWIKEKRKYLSYLSVITHLYVVEKKTIVHQGCRYGPIVSFYLSCYLLRRKNDKQRHKNRTDNEISWKVIRLSFVSSERISSKFNEDRYWHKSVRWLSLFVSSACLIFLSVSFTCGSTSSNEKSIWLVSIDSRVSYIFIHFP